MLYYQKLHPEARVPDHAYEDAIGYDLYACLITESGRRNVRYIPPNFSQNIETRLILAVKPGFYLEICSRSGLAGGNPPIFVANAPAIIDPDYRGEIRVVLFNGGREPYKVEHGERIAQAVIRQRFTFPMEERVLENEDTPRGTKGFGSTGRS